MHPNNTLTSHSPVVPHYTKVPESPKSPAPKKATGSKNIKVVDYAYTSQLLPIPEIFNQHIGLVEVEYYWNLCN